jgi:pimeloyl-ACP methyl ester carboxylesterase
VGKIAVACAAGLLVTALTAGEPALGSVGSAAKANTTSVSTASSLGSLHFGKCPTKLYPDLKKTKVRCTTLQVPMNYSDPSGPKVSLAVSLLRHTSSAKNYKGVILSNPGGPGGGGLDLNLYLAPYVPNGVGKDYDWIGFDPRGVGASKPTLSCERNYFAGPRRNYTPTSKSILRYWLKRSKQYANACEAKNPELLDNMTTIDSARDMNSIREALGVDKISYYGFSYGTYLGQVFSTLYPTHLKYMVLDSNVDPRRVWYGANLDQDRAFDRNIRIYFRWVAKYQSFYHLGSTEKAVYNRYYSDLAKLLKHPDGALGGDEFSDAMENASYYRSTWILVAQAWAALDNSGNAKPMTTLYQETDGPGDDNEFAVYNAVQCTDVQWPTSWAKWQRDNTRINKKHPFLTWGNVWFNAPCLYWKAPAQTPVTINGKATKSVLLIDETLDAATPYPGSLEVRKLYPNSSLIAEPGGGTHADSLSGDKCVDNKIAAYLKSGTRPSRKDWSGPDALCKPLPDPVPKVAKKNHSRTAHIHA